MQLDFGFPRLDVPSRDARGQRARVLSRREQQYELIGFDRLQQHTVFFALFADPDAARRIDETRRVIAARSGQTVGFADPARLHMSLICLCKQSARPLAEEAEQAAADAARFVRCAPFDITLDRATTFGPTVNEANARRPVVLTTSDMSAMRNLHERLHGVLERGRIIGGKPRPFTPHVTMFYGAAVPPEAIAPIRWTVREFHLVHSLHGKSQYSVLASFPLRA